MVLPVLKGTENTSNARNNSIGNLKKKTLRLAKMAVKLRTNRPTYSTLLPIQEIGLLKKKPKKKKSNVLISICGTSLSQQCLSMTHNSGTLASTKIQNHSKTLCDSFS